jgi:hypothetical protein
VNLINKQYIVKDLNIRRFDNSEEYVVVKKTRQGIVKVLKPEVVKEIKLRVLEGDEK